MRPERSNCPEMRSNELVCRLVEGTPFRQGGPTANTATDCYGRSMDRLDLMLEDIREFVRERDWEKFHDPKNLAMAVASEAGELLAELRWVRGEESDDHCRQEPYRGRVADEIADVAVTLLMLADRIDLDLAEAVTAKMEKNRAKYPAEEWRGR